MEEVSERLGDGCAELAELRMAGYGDELIATGLARGASKRGKRIAFGDGRRIKWGPYSSEIFRGNPNIAAPGCELDNDIEWINYYKGHRLYNIGHGNRWEWNYSFRPKPGEVFLDKEEVTFAKKIGSEFIIIEPNVPWHKAQATNKNWGIDRYQAVASGLREEGYDVAQFAFGRDRLSEVRVIETPSFRHSMAVLQRAQLVICPEGGMHHAAAAVRTHAVVLFGGFIPPEATGYSMHTNMVAGGKACGWLGPCLHCRAAMQSISVEDVLAAARRYLNADNLHLDVGRQVRG